MSQINESSGHTVTMKRTFNVPVEVVWEEWTQPEHIAKWWGPQGMETKVITHEFKVGGQWKYSMAMPNGQEFISEGVYREIVPLEKIITSADFKPMTEGVELHVLMQGEGDVTHFTFKVVHSTEEYRIEQEKMGIYNGWGSVFDRLQEFVEADS
ncbi:MAG: SRPBCC domain-containing protein [Bacteroidota bacterium]